ncbi:hypothetical protein NC653_007988 [Populus alba x Populus x berolinensis]|uniref:Uncharacterized protein n=1 Tax=Populus alba x Populus x berolinensis TaxID=444605 RepID=A0AAD6W9F2_9ROSI|nr:hypothetical protein NC653_007988 [Populus alba x Populus x berolinensis]
MIEKYLSLTMQMSSVSFTYTIFTLWTRFCCSIISIASDINSFFFLFFVVAFLTFFLPTKLELFFKVGKC